MQDKNSLVAQIVASYATRPDATVDAIVALATRLSAELGNDAPAAATAAPAVRAQTTLSAESAVTHDKIYCLCCGKGFKMLKRHLGAEHNMSEQMYRETFGLGDDYPLVAPGYSERKASYARSVGFGRYSRQAADAE